jgi:hypothetical protein
MTLLTYFERDSPAFLVKIWKFKNSRKNWKFQKFLEIPEKIGIPEISGISRKNWNFQKKLEFPEFTEVLCGLVKLVYIVASTNWQDNLVRGTLNQLIFDMRIPWLVTR